MSSTQAKNPRALELMQQMVAGEAPPPPIGTTLGMRLTEVEPGRATFEMEADERFYNPMGTVHGGIFGDICDAAMGCAMASTLAEGETFTSLDLSIKFFKPIWKAKLTARATVVKLGRTTGYVECELTDEKGSMVAKAHSSCMILRGEMAKGR